MRGKLHAFLMLFTSYGSAWSQGPVGKFSEEEILNLLTEARAYIDPDTVRYLSAESRIRGRKFMDEHKAFLDSLGKKTAFYYIKMAENSAASDRQRVSEHASSARFIFWVYQDEYSPEEKKALDQVRLLLDPVPQNQDTIDRLARMSAEQFKKANRKSMYELSERFDKPFPHPPFKSAPIHPSDSNLLPAAAPFLRPPVTIEPVTESIMNDKTSASTRILAGLITALAAIAIFECRRRFKSR